ncbi:MAG: hypothetical protein Q7K40_03105 [bacterium]|nr:hypothetical protein [bacterium]
MDLKTLALREIEESESEDGHILTQAEDDSMCERVVGPVTKTQKLFVTVVTFPAVGSFEDLVCGGVFVDDDEDAFGMTVGTSLEVKVFRS